MEDAGSGSATPAAPKLEEPVLLVDLGSDVGIGMNDETLMDFNTWNAERPELLESGAVTAWNEHDTKTFGVLWWGPTTAGLDQVREEAGRRGIKFVVRPAKYAPADLDAAVQAVIGASAELQALGFDLSALSGRGLDDQGLSLDGRAAAEPDAVELPEDLIRRVRHHVASLPGVSGLIAPDDVRVKYGYYYY